MVVNIKFTANDKTWLIVPRELMAYFTPLATKQVFRDN